MKLSTNPIKPHQKSYCHITLDVHITIGLSFNPITMALLELFLGPGSILSVASPGTTWTTTAEASGGAGAPIIRCLHIG